MSSDPEHDWVRRMLSDATQEQEPAPDWVAARIEDTLAQLRQEGPPRQGAHGGSTVVEMTPRRHRRWAGVLIAAAAITVGGYSVGASGLLGDLTGGEAESTSAADAGGSARDSAPEAGALLEAPGVASLSSGSLRADARLLARELSGGAASDSAGELSAPPQVQGEAAEEARDGLAEAQEGLASKGAAGAGEDDEAGRAAVAAPCSPLATSVRGILSPVTFDGAPATAVVRSLDDGRTRVQVWSCDGTRRLAQVAVRP